MAEDWRLTVRLHEGSGHTLGSTLHDLELDQQVQSQLGSQIAVSADADHVFLYADTRGAAEQAEALVAKLLEGEGSSASFTLERWHPLEEEWEAAEVSLPATAEELAREQERLSAKDEADSQASGFAEWELRLDLPSHRDAVALARQLEAEGLPVTRRWRYLLVGAHTREEAGALALRLKGEAPTGTSLQVQPGGEMTWEAAPRRSFLLFVLPG